MSTKSIGKRLKAEVEDSRILLRSIPSPVVTLFVVSVIAMNLLANKELFNAPWIALDCGYTLSWVSFLLMDMICKRFGPKASMKISVLALVTNLALFAVFNLISLIPGHWGAYYDLAAGPAGPAAPAATLADAVLNSTIGGSWYVVIGSATAMLLSSAVNSLLNHRIGRKMHTDGYGAFAARSFISTFIAQVVDNFVFAAMVSHVLFGWTWLQVGICSVTCAAVELLCEVLFSPIGYRRAKKWEIAKVGQEYLDYRTTGEA